MVQARLSTVDGKEGSAHGRTEEGSARVAAASRVARQVCAHILALFCASSFLLQYYRSLTLRCAGMYIEHIVAGDTWSLTTPALVIPVYVLAGRSQVFLLLKYGT